MIGETAELAVILKLKDGLSPGLGKAEGELSRFNASAGRTAGASTGISKGVSGVSKAASGLGGALKHARGELGSLISGPLGLIGLGAGLFSIEHLLSESVGEARSFGSEVAKLTALTGESSQAISSLAGALHHFGIEGDAAVKVAGFYEKNVNKVAGANKSGAASTEKVTKATEGLRLAQVKLAEVEAKRHTGSQLLAAQNRLADAQRKLEAATASGGKATAKFGLNLRDAHGKVVDFSTAILRASAYFNDKLIPASTKAATLAALFGRGYTQLIPLLAAGPKAIKAAMEEAAAAGFTVTAQNVKDLAKLREATRALDTSLGGLKLQIGLALVGPLTEASQAVTDFLAHGGTQQITGVVKGAVEVGREVGAAVSSLGPLVKGIADAWNAIPPDFRKLLIGGLVVNKGLKTIFGFDPIDMVRKSVLGVLTGGVKAGVVNVSGGVVNTGGVGGAAAGGGIAGLLKWTAALSLATVAVDLFANNLVPLANQIGSQEHDLEAQTGKFGATASRPDIEAALRFAQEQRENLRHDPVREALDLFGERSTLDRTIKQLTDALDASRIERLKATAAARGEGENLLAQFGNDRAERLRQLAGAKGQGEHLLPALDLLHKDFLAQRALLKEGTDAQKAAAAKAIGKDVTKGVGNLANTKDTLAQLKATRLTVTDPASQRVLDAAIRAVERKIPGREWIGRQLAQGQQIVRSNQTNGQKIAELKQIQQSLISHGDTAAASIVGALLGPVVAAIHGIPTLGVPVPGARGNVSPVNFGPPKPRGNPPGQSGGNYAPISYTTHKAMGGPVLAGSLYTVGEMGPELFKPRVPGTIIPHGVTRRIKQHGISDYNPYPHIEEQNRGVRKAAYQHQRMVWDAEDRFFKNVPKSTAGPVMFNPNAVLDPSQVEFRRGISSFGDRDIPFPGAGGYGGSSRNYYHGQARPRNYYHGQQPLTVNVRTSTSHRDNAGARALHGRYGGTKSEVGAA